MTAFSRELDVGRALAREAGEIALRYFAQGIRYESKPDLSPVTAADRECEQRIARLLEEHFPDDGLLGEEGALKESRSGRRWIVDPIDGTRDYIRGNSNWGVLIGLEAAGEVIAGLAYLPARDEMFMAARGGGAWLNDSRIQASGIRKPADAVLCVNSLSEVSGQPWAPRLLEWMRGFWTVRSMGGCMDAAMVVRGQADLWLDPSGGPWDFAAFKIIAEEAGAKFFNFDGGRSIYGGTCVICAPGLEAEARRFVCEAIS